MSNNVEDIIDFARIYHITRLSHLIILFFFLSCPVISSGEYNDTKRKALATGSCYFLEEPILFEDLKYVWQHVYHAQVNLAKTANNVNCVNKVCSKNFKGILTFRNHKYRVSRPSIKHYICLKIRG